MYHLLFSKLSDPEGESIYFKIMQMIWWLMFLYFSLSMTIITPYFTNILIFESEFMNMLKIEWTNIGKITLLYKNTIDLDLHHIFLTCMAP